MPRRSGGCKCVVSCLWCRSQPPNNHSLLSSPSNYELKHRLILSHISTLSSPLFEKLRSSITIVVVRAFVTRKALTGGLGLGFQNIRDMQKFSYSLPDLPYGYGALEPFISEEIMRLHHQKHHQAYVTNYNKTLEQLISVVDKDDAPTIVRLQKAIKFNGGGHINHSIFWKNLAPVHEGGGEPPNGSLVGAIERQFGSLDSLILKMNAEGAALQGSGWVWLGLDKELGRLVVETTENQDPLVTKGANLVPLLGIDVWEHAYYLQYKNVKPDYLKNIWHVMNWKYASEVYETECP